MFSFYILNCCKNQLLKVNKKFYITVKYNLIFNTIRVFYY